MTVQNLGLGGQPVEFQGCYVIGVNTSLGLAQSPSTCSITLVEDAYSTPPREFIEPNVGSYRQFKAGGLEFNGVITSYKYDVQNISGRRVSISMSDPREIMSSVPMILAPGYRAVVAGLGEGCYVIDAYGAFDDFDNTGVNLSSWNQAGMTYQDISKALIGGKAIRGEVEFNIAPQTPTVFGTTYRFDLRALDDKVDAGYRVNTNLISVADFIQELASRHSFDWYVTSRRNEEENLVDVVVNVIDRSTDNVDIDLDNFLAANSGIVIQAERGYELRNEVACGVLLGAPVEQIREVAVRGLANNPVDLSDEGGSNKYYMTEDEMRYVLTDKEWWRTWVDMNGGIIRYSVGGASVLAPLWDPADATDIGNQIGINPNRFSIETADEELLGKIYEKLKSHATATYGKRFLFQQVLDVDYTDAAWTADAVAGNNDPKEYFRNSAGKTRCFVEFAPTNQLTITPSTAPNFTFGLGENAPQPLPMDLRNSFDSKFAVTNIDKSDWIVDNGRLYVAATIEEGNVVKLDSPVIYGVTDVDEGTRAVADFGPGGSRALGNRLVSNSTRLEIKRAMLKGEATNSIHQKAYQPVRVHLPVKSKFQRYGPVFSSEIAGAQGKLVIDQDDGFAPWEFGSTQVMLDAMQFRIDNASSAVKTVESATITTAGYPKFSIGDSLGFNSNINNISVSFTDGVRTTYELRSFLREFGELSKEELAALSLFARRGGARILPQDSVAFINKYRPVISKQFGGQGTASRSASVGGAGNFE